MEILIFMYVHFILFLEPEMHILEPSRKTPHIGIRQHNLFKV